MHSAIIVNCWKQLKCPSIIICGVPTQWNTIESFKRIRKLYIGMETFRTLKTTKQGTEQCVQYATICVNNRRKEYAFA